ncbi:hypothetical protein [Aquimarina algiphila]|uniref:hypothetical protein n=1 Tax=Aquimarina algiphila TaxID=2047982 RepID=UPI0014314020|nr:hypothetical protein [Aquimarina algiphila]
MLPDHLDEIPPEFLFANLKDLNIDIGEFMYQLLNDNPEAIKIYINIYIKHNTSKPPES